jgi:hypothetical protein
MNVSTARRPYYAIFAAKAFYGKKTLTGTYQRILTRGNSAAMPPIVVRDLRERTTFAGTTSMITTRCLLLPLSRPKLSHLETGHLQLGRTAFILAHNRLLRIAWP